MARRHTAKMDARDAATAEKANQALQLRRAGATYRQLSEQLGIAQGYAHELVSNAIADIPKENAAAVLALELERLDRDLRRCEAAHEKLEARVKAGDDQAIATMLRVMDRTRHIQERRANYLGLDAAKRNEHTGRNGGPIPIVDASRFTDEQLQRILSGDMSPVTGAGGTGEAPSSGEPDDLENER